MYIHVDQPLLGRISNFSLLKITAPLWRIDKRVDPAVPLLLIYIWKNENSDSKRYMHVQCRRTWFDSWVGKISWRRRCYLLQYSWASLMVQTVRNLPAMWESRFDSWVGKIPQKRAWRPTPVFLPGESPRTKVPGGPHSMCHKESDRIE